MRGEEVFLSVMAILAMSALAYPLVRALAERIRPRSMESGVREELQLLREDVLAEVQQARREIAEMGERMDFAERLLAKKIDR